MSRKNQTNQIQNEVTSVRKIIEEISRPEAEGFIRDMIDDYDPVSDKKKLCKLHRLYCILFGTPKIKIIPAENMVLDPEIDKCPQCITGDLATLNTFPDSDYIDGAEYYECESCGWTSLAIDEYQKSFTLDELLEFCASHPRQTVQFLFDILGVADLEYRMKIIRRTEMTVVRLFDAEIGESEETGAEYTLKDFKEEFDGFLIKKMEVVE